MAAREDLEFTYSLTDRIFRLSLGELADFSGAKYDGDFSLSLEEAQRRKHCYVAEQIGIGPGRRILDLGCGWGPLLDSIRSRGGSGVGVTLSSAQAAACRRHGLDVHLHDAREVTRDTFGPFDAVASLGAFEHFCSPEDHRAGRRRGGPSGTVRAASAAAHPIEQILTMLRAVSPSLDARGGAHDRDGCRRCAAA
jgi:cyclopropane-fatty-acyl-phospholipid synthase